MDLPLGWQGFPASHWVQRRVPGARELILRLNCNLKKGSSAEVEKEVRKDEALLVLLHAQPSRLQKLVYRPNSDYERPVPNAPVLRAMVASPR